MTDSAATPDEPIRLVDANDPNEGVVAFLRALGDAMADEAGHDWREVSGFAGRFCGRCDVDEDDPRRERCRA